METAPVPPDKGVLWSMVTGEVGHPPNVRARPEALRAHGFHSLERLSQWLRIQCQVCAVYFIPVCLVLKGMLADFSYAIHYQMRTRGKKS